MKKVREGFREQRLVRLPGPVRERCEKLPIVGDLYVTDIGSFPESRHHWVTRPEGAPTHLLIFCSAGSGWIRAPGSRRVRVPRGCVALLPANLPHEYGASEETPWKIHWIHFAGRRAEAYLRYLDVAPPFQVHRVRGTEAILRGFEDTLRALDRGVTDADLLTVSAGLARTLALIHRERRAMGRKSRQTGEQIARTVEWMSEHPGETPSLADLAARANLSASHYAALFKKQIGQPPLRHLREIRMRRACELLDTTDLRIAEIADRLGHGNPLHISRVFKESVGVSPSRYRRDGAGSHPTSGGGDG